MKIRTLVETGTAGLTTDDLAWMLTAGLPLRAFTHDEGCGVILAIPPREYLAEGLEALYKYGMSAEFGRRVAEAAALGVDFLMFDRDAET